MDEATHKKNFKPIVLKDLFMEKHHDEHFVITFGKSIPFETFDKRYNPEVWAQLVKDHVYAIAGDPQKKFATIQQ